MSECGIQNTYIFAYMYVTVYARIGVCVHFFHRKRYIYDLYVYVHANMRAHTHTHTRARTRGRTHTHRDIHRDIHIFI